MHCIHIIYIVFFDLYTYIHTVCIHFAWDWEIRFSTHSKFASPNLFAFESFMLHQQSPVFALHTQVLQISRHSWHVSVGYKSIHTDRTAKKNLWNLRFCKRWWSCKGQMGICWFFFVIGSALISVLLIWWRLEGKLNLRETGETNMFAAKRQIIANIFRYVGVTIEIDHLLKKGLSYSLIPKPGALQVGHSLHSLYRSLPSILA